MMNKVLQPNETCLELYGLREKIGKLTHLINIFRLKAFLEALFIRTRKPVSA